MGIGENLRTLRTNAGMTQEQLAQAVGIRQCTVAQIERNTKALSLSLGYEITKVLDCSLYDLIGEDK